jgi:RimJ/RimL family protein N-acetyltransferase
MILSRLTRLRRSIAARVEVRVFAWDLEARPVPVRPRIEARIRAATVDDVPRLAPVLAPVRAMLHELEGIGGLEAAMTEMFRRGHTCYVAERGDAIVHVRWARRTDASIPRFGITAPLLPDEAYGFGSYTIPEARGAGLHAAVLSEMGRYLHDQGVRTLYMWVMSGNAPALRTMARIGAAEAGRVVQWVWRAGRERLIVASVTAAGGREARPNLCAPERLTLRPPLLAARYQTAPVQHGSSGRSVAPAHPKL